MLSFDVTRPPDFAAGVHVYRMLIAGRGNRCNRFGAPGPSGRLIERRVHERYMTRLLADRNAAIKAAAEGDEWCKLLGGKE
jgi:hypothetical protein